MLCSGWPSISTHCHVSAVVVVVRSFLTDMMQTWQDGLSYPGQSLTRPYSMETASPARLHFLCVRFYACVAKVTDFWHIDVTFIRVQSHTSLSLFLVHYSMALRCVSWSYFVLLNTSASSTMAATPLRPSYVSSTHCWNSSWAEMIP